MHFSLAVFGQHFGQQGAMDNLQCTPHPQIFIFDRGIVKMLTKEFSKYISWILHV